MIRPPPHVKPGRPFPAKSATGSGVKSAAGPGARAAAGARSMWLVSFTDLISLLLAFFVLMFSMTDPQVQRWLKEMRNPSARSTAQTPSDAAPVPSAAFNVAMVEPHSAINLDYLGAVLRTQMSKQPELAGLQVMREDDRVVIGLPAEVLFEEDAPAFSGRGRRALFHLGAVLGRIGNRMEVVGHAEREDQASGLAWERSLGRAVAVAMALREAGYRRDLVARALVGKVNVFAGARVGGPRVDIVVRDTGED